MSTDTEAPRLRHGLAAGDAGRQASPDWIRDQGWEPSTAAEHATWKTL